MKPIKLLLKITYAAAVTILAAGCEGDSAGNLAYQPDGSGQGGSLARFAIDGDKLYAVDEETLHVFDITSPSSPELVGDAELGFGVETIFPYNGNVFIGTMTGMHIMDVSNPSTPKKLSTYVHVRACDPVVVQGNYAYVTIRNGIPCFRGANQLDVVDISNLTNPVNVGTYGMLNPHGLGVDGDLLFVTEGQHGYRVFDNSDPLSLSELRFDQNMPAMDVIPNKNNVLIMIGDDGLYQFDYKGFPENEITLLSKIEIETL